MERYRSYLSVPKRYIELEIEVLEQNIICILGDGSGAFGLDILSKGGTTTGLVWSNRGLYPNIQLNRSGVNWLFDIEVGVYRMQDVHPNIHVLLQQNKERSFGFGFTSIALSDALWSSQGSRMDTVLRQYILRFYYTKYRLGSLYRFKGRCLKYRCLIVQQSSQGIQIATEMEHADGSKAGADQCENAPEDIDGYKDDDGCPDPDNDGDGVNDDMDQCPMFEASEDIDGYKDDDGCPDPDNDQDNILDIVDRCPSQPETVNQYQDLTGVQIKDLIQILMGMGCGMIETIVHFIRKIRHTR